MRCKLLKMEEMKEKGRGREVWKIRGRTEGKQAGRREGGNGQDNAIVKGRENEEETDKGEVGGKGKME